MTTLYGFKIGLAIAGLVGGIFGASVMYVLFNRRHRRVLRTVQRGYSVSYRKAGGKYGT